MLHLCAFEIEYLELILCSILLWLQCLFSSVLPISTCLVSRVCYAFGPPPICLSVFFVYACLSTTCLPFHLHSFYGAPSTHSCIHRTVPLTQSSLTCYHDHQATLTKQTLEIYVPTQIPAFSAPHVYHVYSILVSFYHKCVNKSFLIMSVCVSSLHSGLQLYDVFRTIEWYAPMPQPNVARYLWPEYSYTLQDVFYMI